MKVSRMAQQREQQESDFSENQYKGTLAQFLKDPQWKETPEIVHLTIKLFDEYVSKLSDKINGQQLIFDQLQVKTKQLQLAGFNKISKKEIGSLVQKQIKNAFVQSRQLWDPNQHQSGSLTSREQGLDRIMIQQVKAIVAQMNQSREQQILAKASQDFKKHYQSQLQRITFHYSKTQTELEAISNQLQFQSHKNQEIAIYHRKIQHRLLLIEQGLVNQTNDFLDYIRRDNIQKMYNSQTTNLKQKIPQTSELTQKKSPSVYKKQIGILDEKITQISKQTVKQKQFSQFKMRVNKEIAQTVKFEKFQQLLAMTQAQITDKVNSVMKEVSVLGKRISTQLEAPIETVAQKQENRKNSDVKQNEKKPHQKKPKSNLKNRKNSQQQQSTIHPSHSVKQIKDSLYRMQRALSEKEKIAPFKEFQKLLIKQVQAQKLFVEQEISKREKKICQFIQRQVKVLKTNLPSKQYDKGVLGKSVQVIANQMIHCKYLFTGQKQTKGVIIWEKQSANLMQQNFRWRQGQAYVLVEAKGLYKIQAALFGQTDVKCYLQLNGQPVAIFKANDIPQNSQRQSRGYIFSEPMILAAHIKISMRTQSSFYGQAYLQIHRL